MKKIFYDRIKLIFLVMANMLKKETQNNDLSNVFFLEVARLLILFLRMERKRLAFTTNGRPPGIIDSVAVWFAGRY